MNMHLRPLIIGLAGLLLAACHGPTTVREAAPNSTTAVSAQPAPDDTFNAVAWMQTSAEYAANTTGTYRAVCAMLPTAVADPTFNALPKSERSDGFESRPLAVISDVDETLLDNSAYAVRRIESGGAFDPVAWGKWVNEANAKPMPGVQILLDCLKQYGVTLFYITNRNFEGERQPTIDNLRKAGFPLPAGAEDRVLARDDPRGAGGHRNDKGNRRHWVAERYRVVALLGDNLGDFLDGVDQSIAQRAAMADAYQGWWGERWFMFPNPSYGSWEKALQYGCDEAKTAPLRCRHAPLRAQ